MRSTAAARVRALHRLDADEPGSIRNLLVVWHIAPPDLLRIFTVNDFVFGAQRVTDPRLSSWVGTSPLHLAASAHGHDAHALTEALGILRDARPDTFDIRDTRGLTPLSRAARVDVASRIHALVRVGADPSAPYASFTTRPTPRHHWSLLRFAAATGRVAALTSLLACGADRTIVGADGKRALHLGIERGRLACVQMILEADLAEISGVKDTVRRRAIALDRFVVKSAAPLSSSNSQTESSSPATSAQLVDADTSRSIDAAEETDRWERVTDDAESEAVDAMDDENDSNSVAQRVPQFDAVVRSATDAGDGSVESEESPGQILERILQSAVSPSGTETLAVNANRDRGSSLYHLAASYSQTQVLDYLLHNGRLEECHSRSMRNEQGKSAIFMAARSGSIPCLKLFLRTGSNINSVDLESWSVLNEAVKYNRQEIITFILKNGGDVNLPDDDAWTPLHVAGRFGISLAVAPLVSAGADIDALTEDNESPLLFACSQSGHGPVLHELLAHGAKTHVQGQDTITPLTLIVERVDFVMLETFLAHFASQPRSRRPRLDMSSFVHNGEHIFFQAIRAKSATVISHLLSLSVSANVRNSQGDTPLCAAIRADSQPIVHALLSGGADPNYATESGSRAIHIAADAGHIVFVRQLCEYGADVEVPVPKPALHDGFTPLMLSTRRGHTECVSALIEAGVQLNVAKADGYTAVHLAALNGQIDVLKLLIDAGAEVCVYEENSFAPLHVAVRNNQLDAVRTLLSCGVPPDMKGPSGLSALHFSAYLCNARMIWLLVSAGANPDATDNDGSRPLHVSAGRERGRIASQMLLTQGAQVNARDAQGDTPLHSAAYRGLYATVKVLLRRGSDVNAENALGLTALHLAAANGSENTVSALLRAGASATARAANGTTAYQLATLGSHGNARLAIWRSSSQTIESLAPSSSYPVSSAGNSPASSSEVVPAEQGRNICVVCQSALRFGETVRQLTCTHVYHDECIMRWFGGDQLEDHHTCPLCQTSILPDQLYEDSGGGSGRED